MNEQKLYEERYKLQMQIDVLNKRDNQLKEGMSKIYQIVKSGDYAEGEIEDLFNELYRNFYPEEFED